LLNVGSPVDRVVGVGAPALYDGPERFGVDGFGGVDQHVDMLGEHTVAMAGRAGQHVDVRGPDRCPVERVADGFVPPDQRCRGNQPGGTAPRQRTVMREPRDRAQRPVGLPCPLPDPAGHLAQQLGLDPFPFREHLEDAPGPGRGRGPGGCMRTIDGRVHEHMFAQACDKYRWSHVVVATRVRRPAAVSIGVRRRREAIVNGGGRR